MTKATLKIYLLIALAMMLLGVGCKGCTKSQAGTKKVQDEVPVTYVATKGNCTLYRVYDHGTYVYWSVCHSPSYTSSVSK